MSELSLLSLEMQKRSALLVDINSFITKFKGIFANMKNVNAKNLAMFLHEARCVITDDNERCETIENYINSKLGAMMRIKLNGPDEQDHFPAAKYADKWIK